MSARYWVLASDSMFHDGMTWPAGLRFAASRLVTDRGPAASAHYPGASWHLIEDDGASPDLEGRWVELILAYEDGVPRIAQRSARDG